jgi:hypothetical protein
VNYVEYERYQLDLIAIEYRTRGYEVIKEGTVPGLPYRFDAVAKGPEGERVIIEIVNKNQTKKTAERKLLALQAIAAGAPNTKVDFRYIEVDTIALRMASNREQFAPPKLKQVLAERVPQLRQSNVAGQFLNLWQLHAATIRAYAVSLRLGDEPNLTVLDLYNETLRQRAITPPEDIVEDVKMDLFEIFENVQSAIQGAVIEPDLFNQLRLHVLEVRRQIR